MPAGSGVVVAEPVAEVVPPLTTLRGAGFETEFPGSWVKSEVVAAKRDPSARFYADNISAAVAIGSVQPAVEAPAEAVDQVLGVARLETGEPRLADIAAAVAIVVAGVEDVGHAGHEHAPLPAGQACNVFEPVEEERALLVAAVAIGILEDPHAAGLEPMSGTFARHAVPPGHLAVGRGLALGERIIAHLRHPHPSAFVPVDEHGVHHQRLSCHQRRGESRRQPHRTVRFLRTERLRAGHAQQFLVGHPQAAGLHHAAGERHVGAREQRQRRLVAWLSLPHYPRPAGSPSEVWLRPLRRHEKIHAEPSLMRDDEILMAVAIEIDPPDAGIGPRQRRRFRLGGRSAPEGQQGAGQEHDDRPRDWSHLHGNGSQRKDVGLAGR